MRYHTNRRTRTARGLTTATGTSAWCSTSATSRASPPVAGMQASDQHGDDRAVVGRGSLDVGGMHRQIEPTFRDINADKGPVPVLT